MNRADLWLVVAAALAVATGVLWAMALSRVLTP